MNLVFIVYNSKAQEMFITASLADEAKFVKHELAIFM